MPKPAKKSRVVRSFEERFKAMQAEKERREKVAQLRQTINTNRAELAKLRANQTKR